MDIPRMIGIGIVMIVPTIVLGGALWDMFHSWFAVLICVIFMGGCTHKVIKSLSHAAPGH